MSYQRNLDFITFLSARNPAPSGSIKAVRDNNQVPQ
jgi:hypothetical protein